MESLYTAGYDIWNFFMIFAVRLFTTSPTAAGGGTLYAVAHSIYCALSVISVPIATVFFLIAIIKDVVSTPPDQQVRRFVADALKFGVMIGILANLWEIMGAVMEIADGVTSAVSGVSTYTLTMSPELQSCIDQAKVFPSAPNPTSATGFFDYLKDLLDWFQNDLVLFLGNNLYLLMGGLISFITIIASGITIISCAFQRIIKPLVIMPFASITVAMGAGSHEASRVMWQYLKTFLGFCLSGAFMVICIKLGVQLSNHIVFSTTGILTVDIMVLSVQAAATPLVIAGLIKMTDSILARFF